MCAKVWEFEAVDLSGFYSTFKQDCFDKSLLPRNRGRRWPTGRMRGLTNMATCEKSPLTLPSPPIRLRRRCLLVQCANTQTKWGRGDTFRSFQTEQILAKDEQSGCATFAQPRVGPASNASAGPPLEKAPNGGPARLSCRLSHPALSDLPQVGFPRRGQDF